MVTKEYTVSVFGGIDCPPDSDVWRIAYSVGYILGKIPRLTVQTGGVDAGVMGAVRSGVEQGRTAHIVGVVSWGMEEGGIPLYPIDGGKRQMIADILARNKRLLEGDLLIVLPGKGGTLIQLLTAFRLHWMQTKTTRLPRIILVTPWWKDLLSTWRYPSGESVWEDFAFAHDVVTIVERPAEITEYLPKT